MSERSSALALDTHKRHTGVHTTSRAHCEPCKASTRAPVFQSSVSFLFFISLLPASPTDFDTSILPICKDSLGWMFNKLDMNFDLLLDQSELSAIYLDKYELCMKPLFNSCDSFKDGKLSNNEWCYCFQKPEGEEGRRAEVMIRNIKKSNQENGRRYQEFKLWS